MNINPKEAMRLFQTPQANTEQNSKRPSGVEPPEQVNVNSLSDLHELVKKLKPAKNTVSDVKPIIYNTKNTPFADAKFSGHITIPQTGGNSTVRQALIEGFEMIKNHQLCHKATLTAQDHPDDFGGYLPAKVPDPEGQITWLDNFITRRLGGHREGLFVVWNLAEGKYQMNPWTCEIKQSNA